MVDVSDRVMTRRGKVPFHELSIDHDIHLGATIPILLTELVLHRVVAHFRRGILEIGTEGLVRRICLATVVLQQGILGSEARWGLSPVVL